MSLVQMSVSSIGGVINTQYSGNVACPSDGIVTVDARDVPGLLAAGGTYISAVTRTQTLSAAPILATAGRLVASAALSNGTYAIANQPDVPRLGVVRIDPGTTAITAGTVAVVYTANDGTTQTDSISLITAASTVFSTNTSKGIVLLSTVTVAALAGGTSPKFQVNDSNAVALTVDPGFVDFAVIRANADGANETIGSVIASAGCIIPTTAPNATHTYSYIYKYNAPNT